MKEKLIFSPFYSHGTEAQGEKVVVTRGIVPLAATWMDLEILILMKSDRERQIS